MFTWGVVSHNLSSNKIAHRVFTKMLVLFCQTTYITPQMAVILLLTTVRTSELQCFCSVHTATSLLCSVHRSFPPAYSSGSWSGIYLLTHFFTVKNLGYDAVPDRRLVTDGSDIQPPHLEAGESRYI